MMDHLPVPPICMLFRITRKQAERITYLTVSRFFIDEIANSKHCFMNSSPLAYVMSFDISLRLITFRNLEGKLDKLQTHLKRSLSVDIAEDRRPMGPGGLGNGS
jgi:hypothetical protein